MLFNSFDFILFLPIVFLLFWFTTKNNLKKQNILLLIASYFFYACWDYRFLGLLIFSTLLDYLTGIQIEKSQHQNSRKMWLLISLIINIGFLGIFKYYDFFVTSFADALLSIGLSVHPVLLNVILPVGISFYTFHGLSYVLDIYNKKIKAEKNFIDYALFVSFFPLLVAGPIERATHLLPQIKKEKVFNYSQAVNGLRQILWGFFKKVVVADNCAVYVNAVFSNYHHASASQLMATVILFSFQIYGDFSGYSDIALGTAKLFGIELLRNFNYPFFSRSVAEFWRRWHISLSSWFKDYVYIPLGGSRVSKSKQIRNTFIIFLISGFWHGANWTFILWGLLHALYIMPSILFSKNRTNLDIVAKKSFLPNLSELLNMLFTFVLVSFAFFIFRSDSLSNAIDYLTLIPLHQHVKIDQLSISYPLISIFIMLLFEWFDRMTTIPFLSIRSLYLRRFSYLLILLLIFFMGAFINPRSFIYFQF